MCFSSPPPWVKKLSFFTGIQPLNFLTRNFLINEPGVAYGFGFNDNEQLYLALWLNNKLLCLCNKNIDVK